MVDKPCKCHTCKCGKEEWTAIEKKMTDFTRPFTEDFIGKNKIIRKFDPNAEDHLFKWHIDPESRIIKVINENDWKFQIDNQLPQDLEINKLTLIRKGVYHRLIKGTSELHLEIELIES